MYGHRQTIRSVWTGVLGPTMYTRNHRHSSLPDKSPGPWRGPVRTRTLTSSKYVNMLSGRQTLPFPTTMTITRIHLPRVQDPSHPKQEKPRYPRKGHVTWRVRDSHDVTYSISRSVGRCNDPGRNDVKSGDSTTPSYSHPDDPTPLPPRNPGSRPVSDHSRPECFTVVRSRRTQGPYTPWVVLEGETLWGQRTWDLSNDMIGVPDVPDFPRVPILKSGTWWPLESGKGLPLKEDLDSTKTDPSKRRERTESPKNGKGTT